MSEHDNSIVDALRLHAEKTPDRRAFAFLSDSGKEAASLTFAELDRRAGQLAARLSQVTQPGDRVLLAFPPGLGFVVAFLGCLYAKVIAVSTVMPRRNKVRDSTISIIEDCAPAVGLSDREQVAMLTRVVDEVCTAQLDWLAVEDESDIEPANTPRDIEPDSLAFLQYTSGSTSAPKGVMVSHRCLMSNLKMITDAYRLSASSTRVGWIPLHHDMGLVFNVLQAIYCGALCVLMSPMSFLKQPLGWLEAIGKYEAELALGTDYAYQLCVDMIPQEKLDGLDLSSWTLAVSGAEPVRAGTMRAFSKKFSASGFDPRAFHPGYGMAEATLVISGGRFFTGPVERDVDLAHLRNNVVPAAGDVAMRKTVVGCGRAMPETRLAIVNPVTGGRVGDDEIGEIWVQGPQVGVGYWKRAELTQHTFLARLPGEPSGVWLRTGDLGFLDRSGELFVTGRLKDVIIVRGENHYPQDIELTVEKSAPALRKGYGAAFSFREDAIEKVVVVYEVSRTQLRRIDLERTFGDIRAAILQEHGLAIHDCVLVPPGVVPKTTSGKIQRQKTSELWRRELLPDLRHTRYMVEKDSLSQD